MIIFADICQSSYLCYIKIMGCLNIRAEIIPSVPDTDNAVVGKRPHSSDRVFIKSKEK